MALCVFHIDTQYSSDVCVGLFSKYLILPLVYSTSGLQWTAVNHTNTPSTRPSNVNSFFSLSSIMPTITWSYAVLCLFSRSSFYVMHRIKFKAFKIITIKITIYHVHRSVQFVYLQPFCYMHVSLNSFDILNWEATDRCCVAQPKTGMQAGSII